MSITNYWGLFFTLGIPVFVSGCIVGGLVVAAIANRERKYFRRQK